MPTRAEASARALATHLTFHRRKIMTDLAHKTALVTGASRGMGRASARALAQAGAHVIVHYGKGARRLRSSLRSARQAARPMP
jgi:5,10-methylene-tetrahydrofolate dehydrogenase/methenyl tetrahydrofolate cyclohydrolase